MENWRFEPKTLKDGMSIMFEAPFGCTLNFGDNDYSNLTIDEYFLGNTSLKERFLRGEILWIETKTTPIQISLWDFPITVRSNFEGAALALARRAIRDNKKPCPPTMIPQV
jgi:hypothetical protein